MNEELLSEFRQRVEKIVEPLVAAARRKRRMREELIGHLCEAFEEEMDVVNDERRAAVEAVRRLGNREEIGRELQESVSWAERIFVSIFGRKENQMSRFWFVWIVVVLLAFGLVFPQFVGGVLAGLAGVGLARHVKIGGPSARFMLPMLGVLGFLFGMAIILPALAKYKREGYFELQSGLCLVSGILIVLTGVALIIRSFNSTRARVA